MRFLLIFSLFFVILWSSNPTACMPESKPDSQLSCDAILSGLQNKSGDELHQFLIHLDRDLDKSALPDTEIDSIVQALVEIRAKDPFSRYVESKIEAIAADLECLGTRMVAVLLKQCRARIEETPAWSEELLGWTKKLLLLLPWPEAGQAMVSLSEEFTDRNDGESNIQK